MTRLDELPMGTRFRLFRAYRDRKPRPRLKWKSRELADVDLEVRASRKRHAVEVALVGTSEIVWMAREMRVRE
jgi:hypothetical protein